MRQPVCNESSEWQADSAFYAFVVTDFMCSTWKYFFLLCWQAYLLSSQLFRFSLSLFLQCLLPGQRTSLYPYANERSASRKVMSVP
jgi:hypothetical protein